MTAMHKTPEEIGREWADERWSRVYPWRWEYSFTREGAERDDRDEAVRRAAYYGLADITAHLILATARTRWESLQASGRYGRYGRYGR